MATPVRAWPFFCPLFKVVLLLTNTKKDSSPLANGIRILYLCIA